jgi:hypothetical protein
MKSQQQFEYLVPSPELCYELYQSGFNLDFSKKAPGVLALYKTTFVWVRKSRSTDDWLLLTTQECPNNTYEQILQAPTFSEMIDFLPPESPENSVKKSYFLHFYKYHECLPENDYKRTDAYRIGYQHDSNRCEKCTRPDYKRCSEGQWLFSNQGKTPAEAAILLLTYLKRQKLI